MIGAAVKTTLSGIFSILPMIGTATSDVSIATKTGKVVTEGAETVAKGGKAVKDGAKIAKVAKKALVSLSTDTPTRKAVSKFIKAIDPTPDIPLGVVATASALGKAGVPFIDVAPEIMQLLIYNWKALKYNREYIQDVIRNYKEYRDMRLNQVVSKSAFSTN